jgi:hypothetical protein
MGKMMNYYLASQLIADRQSATAASVTRRALVKEARAARKRTAVAQDGPVRLRRRLSFGKPAPATA